MPLDLRDIERALESKLGFRREEGAKHKLFSLYIQGKLVAETKTSRGSGYKTLGEYLVGEMAKQLFVPHQFFVEMVRCTRTRADFLRFLSKRGRIPREKLNEES